METKSKSFTIRRSEWLRGEGQSSMLLRSVDRKKCCLGFYALACGIPEKAISGIGEPRSIEDQELDRPEMQILVYYHEDDGDRMNTTACDELIDINDVEIGRKTQGVVITSEAERESKIAAIFAENGVTVIFED